jgi:hypothetical protein
MMEETPSPSLRNSTSRAMGYGKQGKKSWDGFLMGHGGALNYPREKSTK